METKITRPAVALAATAALALAAPAHAAVVWSDDYTGQTPGAAPSKDFPGGNAGQDYNTSGSSGASTLTVSGTVGNGAPSLFANDAANQGTFTTVGFNQFAPFNTSTPGQEVLRAKFDLRVDSYSGAANASVFRFFVRDTGATGAATKALNIGFGAANVDGQTGNELFFFADEGAGPVPSAANAIGLSNGAFAPGFDFGQSSSTDAASNDTNDEFYRFELVFTGGQTTVTGTATQLSTGNSVAFTRTLSFAPTFANTGADAVGDSWTFILPQSQTGTAYLDNVQFTSEAAAVPEPAAATGVLVGALALLRSRRR